MFLRLARPLEPELAADEAAQETAITTQSEGLEQQIQEAEPTEDNPSPPADASSPSRSNADESSAHQEDTD